MAIDQNNEFKIFQGCDVYLGETECTRDFNCAWNFSKSTCEELSSSSLQDTKDLSKDITTSKPFDKLDLSKDITTSKPFDKLSDDPPELFKPQRGVRKKPISGPLAPPRPSIDSQQRDDVIQSISFAAGWNWFSINVQSDDMSLDNVLSNLTPTEGDFIKSFADGTAQYYEGQGWFGGLEEIEIGKGYQIQLASAGELIFTGSPVDPASTPIELGVGWNWIGYLPQVSLDINDALNLPNPTFAFEEQEGDFIKSLANSAQYYDDGGWFGGLETLDPGQSYMLEVAEAQLFTYPEYDIPDDCPDGEISDECGVCADVGLQLGLSMCEDHGGNCSSQAVCWYCPSTIEPNIDGYYYNYWYSSNPDHNISNMNNCIEACNSFCDCDGNEPILVCSDGSIVCEETDCDDFVVEPESSFVCDNPRAGENLNEVVTNVGDCYSTGTFNMQNPDSGETWTQNWFTENNNQLRWSVMGIVGSGDEEFQTAPEGTLITEYSGPLGQMGYWVQGASSIYASWPAPGGSLTECSGCPAVADIDTGFLDAGKGRFYSLNALYFGNVCPLGWHVATFDDWRYLVAANGGDENAGDYLKSADGWIGSGCDDNCTGFNLLPNGIITPGVGGNFGYDDFLGLDSNYMWGGIPYDDIMGIATNMTGFDQTFTMHTGFGEGSLVNTRYSVGMGVRCVENIDGYPTENSAQPWYYGLEEYQYSGWRPGAHCVLSDNCQEYEAEDSRLTSEEKEILKQELFRSMSNQQPNLGRGGTNPQYPYEYESEYECPEFPSYLNIGTTHDVSLFDYSGVGPSPYGCWRKSYSPRYEDVWFGSLGDMGCCDGVAVYGESVMWQWGFHDCRIMDSYYVYNCGGCSCMYTPNSFADGAPENYIAFDWLELYYSRCNEGYDGDGIRCLTELVGPSCPDLMCVVGNYKGSYCTDDETNPYGVTRGQCEGGGGFCANGGGCSWGFKYNLGVKPGGSDVNFNEEWWGTADWNPHDRSCCPGCSQPGYWSGGDTEVDENNNITYLTTSSHSSCIGQVDDKYTDQIDWSSQWNFSYSQIDEGAPANTWDQFGGNEPTTWHQYCLAICEHYTDHEYAHNVVQGYETLSSCNVDPLIPLCYGITDAATCGTWDVNEDADEWGGTDSALTTAQKSFDPASHPLAAEAYTSPYGDTVAEIMVGAPSITGLCYFPVEGDTMYGIQTGGCCGWSQALHACVHKGCETYNECASRCFNTPYDEEGGAIFDANADAGYPDNLNPWCINNCQTDDSGTCIQDDDGDTYCTGGVYATGDCILDTGEIVSGMTSQDCCETYGPGFYEFIDFQNGYENYTCDGGTATWVETDVYIECDGRVDCSGQCNGSAILDGCGTCSCPGGGNGCVDQQYNAEDEGCGCGMEAPTWHYWDGDGDGIPGDCGGDACKHQFCATMGNAKLTIKSCGTPVGGAGNWLANASEADLYKYAPDGVQYTRYVGVPGDCADYINGTQCNGDEYCNTNCSGNHPCNALCSGVGYDNLGDPGWCYVDEETVFDVYPQCPCAMHNIDVGSIPWATSNVPCQEHVDFGNCCGCLSFGPCSFRDQCNNCISEESSGGCITTAPHQCDTPHPDFPDFTGFDSAGIYVSGGCIQAEDGIFYDVNGNECAATGCDSTCCLVSGAGNVEGVPYLICAQARDYYWDADGDGLGSGDASPQCETNIATECNNTGTGGFCLNDEDVDDDCYCPEQDPVTYFNNGADGEGNLDPALQKNGPCYDCYGDCRVRDTSIGFPPVSTVCVGGWCPSDTAENDCGDCGGTMMFTNWPANTECSFPDDASTTGCARLDLHNNEDFCGGAGPDTDPQWACIGGNVANTVRDDCLSGCNKTYCDGSGCEGREVNCSGGSCIGNEDDGDCGSCGGTFVEECTDCGGTIYAGSGTLNYWIYDFGHTDLVTSGAMGYKDDCKECGGTGTSGQTWNCWVDDGSGVSFDCSVVTCPIAGSVLGGSTVSPQNCNYGDVCACNNDTIDGCGYCGGDIPVNGYICAVDPVSTDCDTAYGNISSNGSICGPGSYCQVNDPFHVDTGGTSSNIDDASANCGTTDCAGNCTGANVNSSPALCDDCGYCTGPGTAIVAVDGDGPAGLGCSVEYNTGIYGATYCFEDPLSDGDDLGTLDDVGMCCYNYRDKGCGCGTDGPVNFYYDHDGDTYPDPCVGDDPCNFTPDIRPYCVSVYNLTTDYTLDPATPTLDNQPVCEEVEGWCVGPFIMPEDDGSCPNGNCFDIVNDEDASNCPCFYPGSSHSSCNTAIWECCGCSDNDVEYGACPTEDDCGICRGSADTLPAGAYGDGEVSDDTFCTINNSTAFQDGDCLEVDCSLQCGCTITEDSCEVQGGQVDTCGFGGEYIASTLEIVSCTHTELNYFTDGDSDGLGGEGDPVDCDSPTALCSSDSDGIGAMVPNCDDPDPACDTNLYDYYGYCMEGSGNLHKDYGGTGATNGELLSDGFVNYTGCNWIIGETVQWTVQLSGTNLVQSGVAADNYGQGGLAYINNDSLPDTTAGCALPDPCGRPTGGQCDTNSCQCEDGTWENANEDACAVCNSGAYGVGFWGMDCVTPCVKDCNGDWGGTAYYNTDDDGNDCRCVDGQTGNAATFGLDCLNDCKPIQGDCALGVCSSGANTCLDAGGNDTGNIGCAVHDDCSVCAGGDGTNGDYNKDKGCDNICCGLCISGTEVPGGDDASCETAPNGLAEDNCATEGGPGACSGTCVGGGAVACLEDCADIPNYYVAGTNPQYKLDDCDECKLCEAGGNDCLNGSYPSDWNSDDLGCGCFDANTPSYYCFDKDGDTRPTHPLDSGGAYVTPKLVCPGDGIGVNCATTTVCSTVEWAVALAITNLCADGDTGLNGYCICDWITGTSDFSVLDYGNAGWDFTGTCSAGTCSGTCGGNADNAATVDVTEGNEACYYGNCYENVHDCTGTPCGLTEVDECGVCGGVGSCDGSDATENGVNTCCGCKVDADNNTDMINGTNPTWDNCGVCLHTAHADRNKDCCTQYAAYCPIGGGCTGDEADDGECTDCGNTWQEAVTHTATSDCSVDPGGVVCNCNCNKTIPTHQGGYCGDDCSLPIDDCLECNVTPFNYVVGSAGQCQCVLNGTNAGLDVCSDCDGDGCCGQAACPTDFVYEACCNDCTVLTNWGCTEACDGTTYDTCGHCDGGNDQRINSAGWSGSNGDGTDWCPVYDFNGGPVSTQYCCLTDPDSGQAATYDLCSDFPQCGVHANYLVTNACLETSPSSGQYDCYCGDTDNSAIDCAGDCAGGLENDVCGVCGGDGYPTTCTWQGTTSDAECCDCDGTDLGYYCWDGDGDGIPQPEVWWDGTAGTTLLACYIGAPNGAYVQPEDLACAADTESSWCECTTTPEEYENLVGDDVFCTTNDVDCDGTCSSGGANASYWNQAGNCGYPPCEGIDIYGSDQCNVCGGSNTLCGAYNADCPNGDTECDNMTCDACECCGGSGLDADAGECLCASSCGGTHSVLDCAGECGGAAVEDSCGCCDADGSNDFVDEGWASAADAGNDCQCGDGYDNGWDGTTTNACGPHYTYDCAGGCGTGSNSNSWTCGGGYGGGNDFECYGGTSNVVTVCNSAENGGCVNIDCPVWGNDQDCKCDCGDVNTWDCLGTTCGGAAADDACGECQGSGESQACGCGPAGALGTANCLSTGSHYPPGPVSYPIRGCIDNATGDYGAGAASGAAAGNYCWNAAYEDGGIPEEVYGESPVSPDSWQDVCYQYDQCGWCNGMAGTPNDQVRDFWTAAGGWKCNSGQCCLEKGSGTYTYIDSDNVTLVQGTNLDRCDSGTDCTAPRANCAGASDEPSGGECGSFENYTCCCDGTVDCADTCGGDATDDECGCNLGAALQCTAGGVANACDGNQYYCAVATDTYGNASSCSLYGACGVCGADTGKVTCLEAGYCDDCWCCNNGCGGGSTCDYADCAGEYCDPEGNTPNCVSYSCTCTAGEDCTGTCEGSGVYSDCGTTIPDNCNTNGCECQDQGAPDSCPNVCNDLVLAKDKSCTGCTGTPDDDMTCTCSEGTPYSCEMNSCTGCPYGDVFTYMGESITACDSAPLSPNCRYTGDYANVGYDGPFGWCGECQDKESGAMRQGCYRECHRLAVSMSHCNFTGNIGGQVYPFDDIEGCDSGCRCTTYFLPDCSGNNICCPSEWVGDFLPDCPGAISTYPALLRGCDLSCWCDDYHPDWATFGGCSEGFDGGYQSGGLLTSGDGVQSSSHLPEYLFNKGKIHITGVKPSKIATLAGVYGAMPDGGTLWAVEVGNFIYYYHEGSDDPATDPRNKPGVKILYGEEYYRQNPR